MHQISFHYFFGRLGGWMDGWMVGELESNANLSFQVEAELGNKVREGIYLVILVRTK